MPRRASWSVIGTLSSAWIFSIALSPSAVGNENGAASENGIVSRGPLDGMSFVGSLGPAGKPGDREDVIRFADGQFWSENCVPCGFPPGPYWVRYEGDEIHFQGELESPESGEFTYSGVVRDGQLTIALNWRQERWYWSIERDFWFEGTLMPAPVAGSSASPADIAMAALSDPRACEP